MIKFRERQIWGLERDGNRSCHTLGAWSGHTVYPEGPDLTGVKVSHLRDD